MSTWFQKILVMAVAMQIGGAALEAKADYYPSGVVSQYLNAFYSGYTVLPIRRILNIGPEYSERRIEYVTLTASAQYSNATAQLVINGRAIGYPQVIGPYNQDFFFYPEPGANEINDGVGTIQLVLNGNVRVDSVAIRFDDYVEPRYPMPPAPPAPPAPYYPPYQPYPSYPGGGYRPEPPRPMPPFPGRGEDHDHDHGRGGWGGGWGGGRGGWGGDHDDHRGGGRR